MKESTFYMKNKVTIHTINRNQQEMQKGFEITSKTKKLLLANINPNPGWRNPNPNSTCKQQSTDLSRSKQKNY